MVAAGCQSGGMESNGWKAGGTADSAGATLVADTAPTDALEDCAEAVAAMRQDAAGLARGFGLAEASDFAARIEEISRSLEYLKIIAAHAVARTRDEAGSSLNDGYRNASEFLRARLRIGIHEARGRLTLAPFLLPQTGLLGQEIPARTEELAAAAATGDISSRSASIITTTVDTVRHLTDPATLARVEHALTATAAEADPDFLNKVAKRWVDALDQDGPEPSEEALRQLQGAFVRNRRRNGLHYLEIFATAEQFETLTTAMNVATNPRLTPAPDDTHTATDTAGSTSAGNTAGNTAAGNTAAGTSAPAPELDRRSRAQKLLDGLVGACSLAMSTGKLPANGGLKPHIMVTIDHRDLLHHLTPTNPRQSNPRQSNTGPASTRTATNPTSTAIATFTGPIHPNTIRKIACDADILPVLLGTGSEILDIGRTTRIFPPHIRKAITARDGGCTFPDCTMPAPWCEAHHITYWSQGGTTGTHNGALLCSHHHHLIHKEQWRIDMTTGAPWFIPPPHIDPRQTPRRNHHHTPLKT
ncbi:HNH endonuclease [Paenarthrobacter ilicis]